MLMRRKEDIGALVSTPRLTLRAADSPVLSRTISTPGPPFGRYPYTRPGDMFVP